MNQTINIGERTIVEYNIIMKQLASGQLGECIELFMKLRQIGAQFQAQAQAPGEPRMVPPPPKAE